MFAITVSVIVASLLCLAFKSLRWIGVWGVALLAYLYPFVFLALLICGAVIVFVIYHQRSSHVLPARRD
jgi:hypothetical protein